MALGALHLGKYFAPHRGGMETFLGDLMAAQQRAGLRVAALVHSSQPALRESREQRTVGGQSLTVIRAGVWLTLFFAPLAPGFLFSLRAALRRERPDILHLHLPNPSVFWLLLLPGARSIPWVLHWHSDVIASPHSLGLRLLYPLYRPFEQAMLRRAARIIVTSPPYLESSRALRGHRARCEVIPLGLDPQRLTARGAAGAEQAKGKAAGAGSAAGNRTSREPAGAAPRAQGTQQAGSACQGGPGEALRLIAVGRLTYYKGFATLIDALTEVPGARLSIVGEGDERRALEAQIDRLGLHDRITLCGGLVDGQLAGELRAADLLCLPSVERSEAFGVVLLEAMAVGLPVLASDLPGSGMPWLVRVSGAGCLAAPGDAAAFAREIRSLAGDRARLRALGEAGRRSFQTRFHIDVAARDINGIYGRAIAASGSAQAS
jgi:glycosyltransferase involved in cell wall biosynthesis